MYQTMFSLNFCIIGQFKVHLNTLFVHIVPLTFDLTFMMQKQDISNFRKGDRCRIIFKRVVKSNVLLSLKSFLLKLIFRMKVTIEFTNQESAKFFELL